MLNDFIEANFIRISVFIDDAAVSDWLLSVEPGSEENVLLNVVDVRTRNLEMILLKNEVHHILSLCLSEHCLPLVSRGMSGFACFLHLTDNGDGVVCSSVVKCFHKVVERDVLVLEEVRPIVVASVVALHIVDCYEAAVLLVESPVLQPVANSRAALLVSGEAEIERSLSLYDGLGNHLLLRRSFLNLTCCISEERLETLLADECVSVIPKFCHNRMLIEDEFVVYEERFEHRRVAA